MFMHKVISFVSGILVAIFLGGAIYIIQTSNNESPTINTNFDNTQTEKINTSTSTIDTSTSNKEAASKDEVSSTTVNYTTDGFYPDKIFARSGIIINFVNKSGTSFTLEDYLKDKKATSTQTLPQIEKISKNEYRVTFFDRGIFEYKNKNNTKHKISISVE